MPTPPAPPASAADLEALADRLSACADALHARLMRALRPPPLLPGPGAGLAPPQEEAQALFEAEVALRQRANTLYLGAATLAAGGLGGDLRQLLDVTARARDSINRVNRLRDLADIAAELLAMGAAVAAGRPEHLAAPLEQLRHHLDDLHQARSAPPA